MLKGEVRIIGGKWRSRKISVPKLEGLRPTPDSVRETVFNWLQHDIVGANCLDLFSGTGAMAFEALSRGAAQVTLVEQAKGICQHLEETAQKLQIDNEDYTIINEEAFSWLKAFSLNKKPKAFRGFDVVFLDPPYHQHWLEKVLPVLFSEPGLLKPNALIYVESEKEWSSELLPQTVEILKHKKAGMVHYFLLISR